MLLFCKPPSPLHPRMLWLKLPQWFLRRFINVYLLYCNYLSWIKAWPIILTNLNTLYSAKFGLNWPRSSFLRRFLNFVHVFSLFHNYLLLKKVWPFIWINLNPLHQECFVPSLVDLAQWFSRRWKCEKFTDKWTDGLFAIRKAQVSYKKICQVYNFHVTVSHK